LKTRRIRASRRGANPRAAEPEFHLRHGLRAILRQDPDVVMVGEIRDSETRRSPSAALTATRSSARCIRTIRPARDAIIDMGVEAFLISSSLEGVLAQRLVRRICPSCRIESACRPRCAKNWKRWRRKLTGVFYTAGMRGMPRDGIPRAVGIFELLAINPELRNSSCRSGRMRNCGTPRRKP